ncbi:MAG: hypothetical protein LAT50_16750 [Ectothiorhodospiraceae bacterium]|nr:hypothetical protein [Ectothiorhodospiraceae bacterium]
MKDDGLACYPSLDNESELFMTGLRREDVIALHEANVDGDGSTLMGAVDVLGAGSAGVFTGAHGMGSQYIQRVDGLQRLLDQYRAADRITRHRLKPQIERAFATISHQYAREIQRAASHRSRRPSRNPYLTPQRAMNIAADNPRGIDLKDNRDIRRRSRFLQNARFVGGVGTVAAVGIVGYEAYHNAQNGDPWVEDTLIAGAQIGGAALGGTVVLMAAATGPVGWVILGAGAAGIVGSAAAGRLVRGIARAFRD